MNVYSAIIVDAEELTRDEMKNKLIDIKLFDVQACFSNIADAQGYLKNRYTPVDFIFCDIEMDGLNGGQAVQSLRQYCNYFIYCTGDGRYATTAHEHLVDGCFPKRGKPILKTILLDAIPSAEHQTVGKKTRVLLNTVIEEIRFFRMEGNYLYAYGLEIGGGFRAIGRTNISIKDFMAKYWFMENMIRINQSEVLNMDHVRLYSDETLTVGNKAFFINKIGKECMRAWFVKHIPNARIR